VGKRLARRLCHDANNSTYPYQTNTISAASTSCFAQVLLHNATGLSQCSAFLPVDFTLPEDGLNCPIRAGMHYGAPLKRAAAGVIGLLRGTNSIKNY